MCLARRFFRAIKSGGGSEMSGNYRYIRICYRPSTILHPIYFGGVTPRESNVMASTLVFPTIYTVAGASLNLFSLLTGVDYGRLVKSIVGDGLKIYGVYALKSLENMKHVRRILLPYSADNRPWRMEPSENITGWASGIPLYRAAKQAKTPSKSIQLARLEHKDRGWKVAGVTLYRYVSEERIGIALERSKKRVAGDRALFSYTVFHGIKREGGLSSLLYCVEIAWNASSGLLDALYREDAKLRGTINFGGRHSVAEYFVVPLNEEPPFASSVENISDKGYRLAASHVAVRRFSSLTSIRGECIKLVCGGVGIISGWDFAAGAQKRPVSAILPGSLYRVERLTGTDGEMSKCKWYFKLLRSSIPIINFE